MSLIRTVNFVQNLRHAIFDFDCVDKRKLIRSGIHHTHVIFIIPACENTQIAP